MSSGTNTERLTQNNTKISTNNTAIDNFKTAIQNLPTRANLQIINETIKDNGLAEIWPEEGYDGIERVELLIDIPSYPPNWAEIGYDTAPQNIVDDFNYSKTIYDTWIREGGRLSQKFQNDKKIVYMPFVDTSNSDSMFRCFYGCENLIELPLINTSNVTNLENAFWNCIKLKKIPLLDTHKVDTFYFAFSGCESLEDVPVLDTSSATNLSWAFYNCNSLTNESLNNILRMCINVNQNYLKPKTLADLKISQAQATICQTLPSFSDFINAGWTTGY